MHTWANWSGSLRFDVQKIHQPETVDELQSIVTKCRGKGTGLRLAAAGHSSSPLVETGTTLVNLDRMKGLVQLDKDKRIATLRAGTTVHEANTLLQKEGWALFNTGDVDVQTLAGAISTGTHGSGRKLQNLASTLHGVTMINYKGEADHFSQETHPDEMRAMRVSLGSLGIFPEIVVRIVPLFKLHRLELGVDVVDCMAHFDQLADENRNVDFYWYPRSDETKIRLLNEPGKGMQQFPFEFTCRDEEEGWVGEILPRQRELRFDEMEYAFSRDAGMACFKEIRERIKKRHRKHVAWRVLYRCIAADDFYISPHNGRDSVSISLHHNAGMPFDDYFNDIEPIFIDHGGRPHWAKIHNLKGDRLKPLYPEWDKFQSIRKKLDPEGVFMNKHLTELFNDEETRS